LSLQAFTVRQDWQAADDQVRRDRQTITRVILATLIISVGVTWITDQLLQDAAGRSFSYEASSLCLYVGVLTWYALRRRSEGIKVAASIYGAMVIIMAIVDLLTKVGMTSTAWDAPANRSNPQLNWGMLMLLPLGLMWLAMRRYPAEMRLVGLDLTNPGLKLVLGLVGGAMLGGHFVFSTAFTGALGLKLPPLPYLIWQTGYELGVAALGIECFFQGVLLNHLHYERRWGIWEAALLTSALQVLLTMAKASWRVNPIITIGTLFYVFMRSMISAGLYQRTRNLLPPVISNFVFNMMAIVRL
jgi:membrane protease YdiL (CAAX protease family)